MRTGLPRPALRNRVFVYSLPRLKLSVGEVLPDEPRTHPKATTNEANFPEGVIHCISLFLIVFRRFLYLQKAIISSKSTFEAICCIPSHAFKKYLTVLRYQLS